MWRRRQLEESPQKWAAASVTEEAGGEGCLLAGGKEANVPQTSGPETGVGDRARVRRVSARTQIRLKNGPGMGRPRTKNGRASVWVGALGRLFCLHRPKQTAADEMGALLELL